MFRPITEDTLSVLGMHNLQTSEACEACESDVRGTPVSLKNTPASLKSTPVSLNSTQVSLNSSSVSLMVSSLCWGLFMPRMPRMFCSCLAHLPRMPHWLAYCIHSMYQWRTALLTVPFQLLQLTCLPLLRHITMPIYKQKWEFSDFNYLLQTVITQPKWL